MKKQVYTVHDENSLTTFFCLLFPRLTPEETDEEEEEDEWETGAETLLKETRNRTCELLHREICLSKQLLFFWCLPHPTLYDPQPLTTPTKMMLA